MKRIDTFEVNSKKTIGFLGLGQMGNSLLLNFSNRLLEATTEGKDQIKNIFYLYDTDSTKKETFKTIGFNNFVNPEKIFSDCDLIFLCVKPDIIPELLSKYGSFLKQSQTVVSVAAGISIEFIQSHLNTKVKIIRIMTNHLCLINQGATVFCVNKFVNEFDEQILTYLFESNGIINKVDEKLINAFTAFASSPAFVYTFLEAIVDGGVKNGISYQLALEHGIQILYGASIMLKQFNKNPYNLKYQVTTPGGTTIQALSVLERNRFKSAIIEAFTAATDKAKLIEKEKLEHLKSKF